MGKGPSTAPVGVTRYRIGLVLVMIAVLVSWLEPLVSPHLPQMAARRVLIGALADGMVLVGLFVLGGEFWDKVRALFVHDSRVMPDRSAVSPAGALEPVKVGWRFYLGAAIFVVHLPPGCSCPRRPPQGGAHRRSQASRAASSSPTSSGFSPRSP